MRTTLIYIQLLLVVVILVSSCKKEDFLDRFPQDAISEPTFFKNESDLKLYCNRYYSLLTTQSFSLDQNSDIMVPRNIDPLLGGQVIVPASGGGWTWTNERGLNFFLQRYQRAAENDAVKNRYAGEIRLFRAISYWQKVKRFGDVPWISKDLNDQSPELYNPRDPHKKVMDSVLADLDFAVANLPETVTGVDADRLHKYAALAIKSRICLWEGTFRKYHVLGDETKSLREAANAAEAVITSGKYDIYTTGNPARDYYNLFIVEELNSNKEAIMPRRYIKDVLMHNITRQVGESNNGWSKSFAKSFLCTDGLPVAVSPLYKGDDSLDAERTNRDPRFTQLIATRGFTFQVSLAGVRDTIALPRIGTNVTTTGYQIIKGRSADITQWNANQSTLDLFLCRYAEVLLNYAEAKAELGECDQAVLDNTITKLRSRVGMPAMTIAGLTKDPDSDFPTLPVLIDEIRRERKIELAGDGFRFDDLLRWKAGKLIENPATILGMKLHPNVKAQYPPAQVNGIPLDANNYIRVYTNITARVWNDKYYLYPLPTQELALNPKLAPQNPNW
ncbi:RagB/SusD family nutrient uptake outer membrane protein [Pseudoflavitalea sp. X16]|uniref:RagB/SusD family nutrient uptake outer membrane protein n=1 Tax=Paraflavitalea devenefica TaxID=2716334 RepID=UPI001421AA53|nr:RagB/SusD family nutrient uptake outer membrane protein [Paraflavitalea devenefica]NII29788.1 RagB/SusD family nutrient uptake outer membrane protein [Paraflavitalea devenefica]